MSIKIALAFSNTLFSEGISKLLEQERDFSVVTTIDDCSDCDIKKLEAQDISVVLTDFMTLYNTGLFDDIVLRVEDGEKGKIVTFEVKEKPVIRSRYSLTTHLSFLRSLK